MRLQLPAAVLALLVARASAIAANLTIQASLNPGLAPTFQLITALRCDVMGNTKSPRAFVVGVNWFNPSSGAAFTLIETNDALNAGPCTPGSPIGSPNASAAAIALADQAALGDAVDGFNVLVLWDGPAARTGVSEQSNFLDFKYTTVAMTSFVNEVFSSSKDTNSPKYNKKQTDFGSTAPTYTGMDPVLAPPTVTFGVALVSPVTNKTIYTCAPNGDCYDPSLGNQNPCSGTRIPNIPSAEQCQVLCTANPSCKAFHLDLDTSGTYGGCWWNQCAVCPFKLKESRGTYCWKASPVVTTPPAITAMLNTQGYLYVAGNFTHLNVSTGLIPASGVAVAGNNLPGAEGGYSWQALNSSRVGIAVNNDTVVNAIAALGDIIFFGGSISSLTDGTIVRNLVCYSRNMWFLPSASRYNGNTITTSGRSLDGTDGPITALAVDSSSTPASLYVGGIFPKLVGPLLTLGDVFEPRVNNIALFQFGVNPASPNNWFPLIPTGSSTAGVTGFITAMVFIQTNSVAASLFVAGEFSDYGGKTGGSGPQYIISWSFTKRWSYLSTANPMTVVGLGTFYVAGPAGKINGLLFKPPNALVVYGKFSGTLIEPIRNSGNPAEFPDILFSDYDRPAVSYAVWNLEPEAVYLGQYWALGMPQLLGEVTGAAYSGQDGVIFTGTLATPTISEPPSSQYPSGRTISAKYGNSAEVFLGNPIGSRAPQGTAPDPGSSSNLASVSMCGGDSSNTTISPGPSAPSSFRSGELVFSMARSPGYMIVIDDFGKSSCKASIDNSQTEGLSTVAPTPGGLTGGAVYASALALTNAAVGGGTRAVLVGGAFNSSGNPQASLWPPATTSFGLKSLALYAFPWDQKGAPVSQSQYGKYGRWFYLSAQVQTTTTSGALTFPLPSSPAIPNGTVYALTSAASDKLDSTFFVGGAFNNVLRAGNITYNEITPVAAIPTNVSMTTCPNSMKVANGTNADSVNFGFCLPQAATGCECKAVVVSPGTALLVASGALPANLSKPQYLSATNYWSALAAPSSSYRISVRVNQISSQTGVDFTTIYGDPSLSPILYGPVPGVVPGGAVYKSACGGTVGILFSTGFLNPASTYPAGVNFTVTVETTGCVAVNATGYASTTGNFTNIGQLSLAKQAVALNLAVAPTPDSTKKLEAPAIVSWAPLFDPLRKCAGLPSTVYAFAQPRLKPAVTGNVDQNVIFNPYSPYTLGQLLIVGGSFTTLCDGTPAGGVAVWEASKSAWSPLFDGVSNGVAGTVFAVAAYGKHLFVGGDFVALDSGTAASGIAVYTSISPTLLADPATSFWAPVVSTGGAVGVVGIVRALYVLPFARDPYKAYTFDEPGSGAHVYVGGSFAALTDGTVVNSVVDIFVTNSNNPVPTMTVSAIRNNPNSTAVGVSGGTVFSITAASSCLFFSGDFTALGDGTATQSIATLAIKVFDRNPYEWRSAFPTSGFFLSALPAYRVPPPSLPSPPTAIFIPTSGQDPRYPPPTYYTSQGLTGDSAFTGGRVLLGGLFTPLPLNSTLTNEKLLRTYNSLTYLVQSNDADAGMVVDPVTTWPFYNIPENAVPLA